MSQQTSTFAVLKSLDKTRFSYAVLTLTELRSLLTLSSRGPHLRSFPLITTVTGRTSSRHWQLILVIMEIPMRLQITSERRKSYKRCKKTATYIRWSLDWLIVPNAIASYQIDM